MMDGKTREKIAEIGNELDEHCKTLYNLVEVEKSGIASLSKDQRASKKCILWNTSTQYFKQAEISMTEARQNLREGLRCYMQAQSEKYDPNRVVPIVPYDPNIHPAPIANDIKPFDATHICDIGIDQESGLSVMFSKVMESPVEKWDTIYIFINRKCVASFSCHPQSQIWKPSAGLHEYLRGDIVRNFPDTKDRDLAKAILLGMLIDPQSANPTPKDENA